MHLKKIASRALVLGMVAIAVMATNNPIDWQSPCTDAAVVAKWADIRTQLMWALPSSVGEIGYRKYQQVIQLLGGSFYISNKPDLVLEKKLLAIVGANYMQEVIGSTVSTYLKKYP
ncbi:hypothetical protein GGI21_003760, partial [Coemansia aciculifera]